MNTGRKLTGSSRRMPGGKRVGASNLKAALCLGAVVLAATLMSCGGHQEEPGAISLPPELSAKFGTVTETSIAPFEKSGFDPIRTNELHQIHNLSGLECSTCHQDTQPLTVERQLELCMECHVTEDSELFVAREVWNNHCFSCHYFTGDSLNESSNPPPIETCKTCHEYKDAGEYIFGFYSHAMKGEMSCRTCHKPHANPAVFATDNCNSCHGQFYENDYMKGGHQKCSQCHTPHFWKAPDDLDCTQCHSAPDSVTAHTLPFHPDDCLACHNPHFQDTQIKGGQCSSCHDSFNFAFSANSPAAHMDCMNCHSGGGFAFKGMDNTCRSCHSDQASDLVADFVPAQHQQCTACHQEHTWTASFNNTCQSCHDLSAVVEHNVPQHPKDCAACHDPHMAYETPQTGNCAACHGEGTIPAFTANLPEQHMTCGNCHPADSALGHKFEFVGEESSCTLCHFEAPDNGGTDWEAVPAGHTLCTACHQPHTWAPQFGENSCGICHSAETEAVAGNMMHEDCRSCHVPGHTMEFAGKENSCDLCHADVVEIGAAMGKDDCFLCHTQHDFAVDDANTCTICHSTAPDSGKEWSALPVGHNDCSGCHQPHSWQPSTDGATCIACHSDIGAATKGNDMHSECMSCHTAGHEMEFAGAENSCAVCHADINELMAPMGKDDCSLCHTQHTFAVEQNVCSVCHTDLFATHNVPGGGHDQCMNCHQVHSFEPDVNSCEICHADREDHFPEVRSCVRCHIFRRGG